MTEYRQIGNRIYKLVGKCEPEKCEAFCCRYVVVKIPRVNADDIDYFKAHGIQVKVLGNWNLALMIPARCKHLMDNHKCEIYGRRFESCRNYAKRKSDWFGSDQCGLMWKPVIGREAQRGLKQLKGGY